MGAIVTGWCGDGWGDIAAITVPRMAAYAKRHGHAFCDFQYAGEQQRPASWNKLVAIAAAFTVSDEVLWIDADVAVADDAEDIFAAVPEGAAQAMVRHATPEGDVPNAGVWFLRLRMLPVLMDIAMDDQFVHHRWWEQAPLLQRMGFTDRETGILRRETDTELYRETAWLDERWNAWAGSPPAVRPSFRHACGIVDHAEKIAYLTSGGRRET